MKTVFTRDITLASILDAYGIPKRNPDPVTREVRTRDGKECESCAWWYDVTNPEHADKCKELMDAYHKAKDWAEYSLDREHPLYWMKGFSENRNANLHLFHHGATVMRVIEDGERTIYVGPRLSEKNKQILKTQI